MKQQFECECPTMVFLKQWPHSHYLLAVLKQGASLVLIPLANNELNNELILVQRGNTESKLTIDNTSQWWSHLACRVQTLGGQRACHSVLRTRGHCLPIFQLPLLACPRQRCHCPQQKLEMLAHPKQVLTWAEHMEVLPNLWEFRHSIVKQNHIQKWSW